MFVFLSYRWRRLFLKAQTHSLVQDGGNFCSGMKPAAKDGSSPLAWAVHLSVCCQLLGFRKGGVPMQRPHCCFELRKKKLLVGKLPKPTEIGNFFTIVVYPPETVTLPPVRTEVSHGTLVIQPLKLHTNFLLTADREALWCPPPLMFNLGRDVCLQYTLLAWRGMTKAHEFHSEDTQVLEKSSYQLTSAPHWSLWNYLKSTPSATKWPLRDGRHPHEPSPI